jgi:biopolymer transport protein ExbD
MKKKKARKTEEVNAGSMADIAFLLLIFFLVTTTIASDKGLPMLLPPKKEKDQQQQVEMNERNVFTVLINSKDKLLVEKEPIEPSEIKEKCKKFLSNNGKDPSMSDSPSEAVVSLKADRGTSYAIYLLVLDELTAAYNELRAESVGLSIDDYTNLDKKKPEQNALYEKAREIYPYRLSEAEPTKIGG